MKKLKQRLGQWLIVKGIKLAGTTEKLPVSKTDVKQALDIPTDAVVEASEEDAQWSPNQHGNVVIAEPQMITDFRRRGGDIHDDVL